MKESANRHEFVFSPKFVKASRGIHHREKSVSFLDRLSVAEPPSQARHEEHYHYTFLTNRILHVHLCNTVPTDSNWWTQFIDAIFPEVEVQSTTMIALSLFKYITVCSFHFSDVSSDPSKTPHRKNLKVRSRFGRPNSKSASLFTELGWGLGYKYTYQK